MYNENSFYSIDRLVEFGMGMAVAQQMVKTMNEAITTMRIPGAGNTMPPPPPPAPARVYYVVFDQKQAGPFSETEVARLINEKKISKDTFIWYPGLPAWKAAENIPEILRLVALAPPAIGV
jgi:hypothetical protein